MQLIAGAADREVVRVRGAVDRRTGRLAFCSATATVVARARLTTSVVPFAPVPLAG